MTDFGLSMFETPSQYCGWNVQDDLCFPYESALFPQTFDTATTFQQQSESEHEDRMIDDDDSNNDDDEEDEDFIAPIYDKKSMDGIVHRTNSVKRKLFPEDEQTNSESQVAPKKKRGRPPSVIKFKRDDGKQKGRRKKKNAQSISANATFPGGLWSVRSIPCYFVGCTYSYKRPGSAIVEVSDRPLILPDKFGGYSIRACKKHHDRWKVMDAKLHASKDYIPPFCELCRNLNCKEIDNPDLTRYMDSTKENRKFNLCSACVNRQKKFIPLVLCESTGGDSELDGYESLKDSGASPQKSPTASPPTSRPVVWNASNHYPHGEEERDVPSSGKMKDTGDSTSVLIVCKTSQPATWLEAAEYCSRPVTDGTVPSHLMATSDEVVFSEEKSPYTFQMKVFEEEDEGLKYKVIGVFAEQSICAGVCIGEFCGRVVKKKDSKKHPRRAILLQDVMIDASKRANEIAYIRDVPISLSGAHPSCDIVNIKFQISGNHAIAITTRNIEQGEELIADYSTLRTRYNRYLEVLDRIHKHNNEVLDESESKLSTLKWFIADGFQKLKKKTKIHIPKPCRLPPKRGNASSKKQMRIMGYVTQLLALDLERAKENTWTCFIPSCNMDYEALNLAIKKWKKAHSEYNDAEAIKSALKAVESPNRAPEMHQIQNQAMIIDEAPIHNSTVTQIECRNLNEIPNEDIEIRGLDALKNGGVVKGEWKGYPVCIRYPQNKDADPQKQRNDFIQACNISAINHPNLVNCFGMTNKDGRLGLVTEHMNLGNLKQWCSVTSLPVQSLYIPRIAMDIARGMYEIHSRGLLHTNLRYSNVLIKGDNSTGFIANMETKIGDLLTGLYTQEMKVNPEIEKYLAPEVFSSRQFSKASDVYAYGVLLCILFSGRPEDTITRPMDVLINPAFLQAWGPKWQNLLRRCVDRNPSNRPSFVDILAITQSLTREAEGIH